jgi:hypothetical protein
MRFKFNKLIFLASSIFLILPVFASHRVQALQLSDSESGFSADLNFPGATLCINYPESLRDDKNCAGLNFPALREDTRDLSILGMGAIRFEKYHMIFYVTAYSKPKAGPVDEEIGRKMLKGFLEGVAEKTDSKAVSLIKSGMEMVNGQPLFRSFGDVNISGSQHVRFLFYDFSGADHRFTLSLVAAPGHDRELQSVGDQFMEKVKVPPPTGSYESERDYARGLAIGRLVGITLPILVFLGIVIWIAWKILAKPLKRGSGQ